MRNPKQVVLDLAEETLHDIFPDSVELNTVETKVIAAESPGQARITEGNGRVLKLVLF